MELLPYGYLWLLGLHGIFPLSSTGIEFEALPLDSTTSCGTCVVVALVSLTVINDAATCSSPVVFVVVIVVHTLAFSVAIVVAMTFSFEASKMALGSSPSSAISLKRKALITEVICSPSSMSPSKVLESRFSWAHPPF